MTEIQKQKPYFYLKSKNEKLDDMIVREVNTTNNDSRYFHIVFTYGKKTNLKNFSLNKAHIENGTHTLIPCPENISHLPSDDMTWFEYQPNRFRYKMMYDVMLENDEIIESCYPNGITFTCFKSKQELSEYAANLIKKQHGDIKDSQIKAIRLCKLLKPLEHSDDLMPNTEIQVSSNFKVFKEWIVGNAKE